MFRRKEEEDLLSETGDSQAEQTTESQNESSTPASTSSTTTASQTSSAKPSSETTSAPRSAVSNPYRPVSSGGNDSAPRARLQEVRSPIGGAANNDKASGNKSSRRILTVGNDILLKGEIATCDRLVIEGEVDATLNDVHTVEIAETGSFHGSAEIEDAEISGVFEGDLIVRNRLIIYSSGKVRGTITYGEIEIERGGELTGEIKTGAATGSKKSKSQQKEAA